MGFFFVFILVEMLGLGRGFWASLDISSMFSSGGLGFRVQGLGFSGSLLDTILHCCSDKTQ